MTFPRTPGCWERKYDSEDYSGKAKATKGLSAPQKTEHGLVSPGNASHIAQESPNSALLLSATLLLVEAIARSQQPFLSFHCNTCWVAKECPKLEHWLDQVTLRLMNFVIHNKSKSSCVMSVPKLSLQSVLKLSLYLFPPPLSTWPALRLGLKSPSLDYCSFLVLRPIKP